ncbi:uncharacterized protein LOC100875601 [Megachile rotundata]|uniref:uncharacterized protein LOC100875601 n=1 Tax=Megachile rotundata TaxID=143995 RepID=UPI003FD0409B
MREHRELLTMIVSENISRPLASLVLFAVFCYALDQRFDPAIPCSDSQGCIVSYNSMKNASCRNGFCVCNDGTTIKNCSSAELMHQTNRSAVAIYQTCKVQHDCAWNNSFCNTTASRCECLKGYILSSSKKSCLQKAKAIDYPCIDNTQCLSFSQNTTCQSGQCTCLVGYHFTENACYKTIDLEAACTVDEECAHVEGAVCNEDKICNCPAATVLSESKEKCLPVAREIFQNCTEHVQCNETFVDSLCVDGKCRCREKFHFEVGVQQCYVDKGLDEVCGNTYECYQANESENATKAVRCSHNICTCAENFSREGDKCVSEGTPTMESPALLLLAAAILFSTR